MVLPTGDLLPMALEDPAALDELRIKYKVWITFDKPNVLNIQCHNTARLREAVRALHWRLHDMRLSDDQGAAGFMVQKRIEPDDCRLVRVLVGYRPTVIGGTELAGTALVRPNGHVTRKTCRNGCGLLSG